MYCMAGILLVLAWMLYLLWLHDPVFKLLVYAGWFVLAIGLVLVFWPMTALRTKGNPAEGKDFTHTTRLVTGSIYRVVRHPLYLGWCLMYIAAGLFSQHWVVAILASLGVACIVQMAEQEDRHLIEKFGGAYARYMDSVPGMNLLAGIVRLVQQKPW